MKPYSKEFRGEVLAAWGRGRSPREGVAAGARGRTTREVATYFDVSESWVRRVKQEPREQNKVAPCLTRRNVSMTLRHLRNEFTVAG
jgi:transposase